MQNSYFRTLSVLVKYRLSLAVSFSALTGYLVTGLSNPAVSLILFTGVFLLASGTITLNQIQERKFDALMERTKNRPLPSGEVSLKSALLISVLLITAGLSILGIAGLMPVLLGALNIVLYNLIYTPLKRFTSLAIIPGSLVGAVCPLIGWSATGLSLFEPAGLFIAIFVFLWQIPHFWLLLIQYSNDYKRAGFAGIFNYLKPQEIRILVFVWVIITSLFLFTFPFFDIRFNHAIITLLITLNLLFILMFYRCVIVNKEERYIKQAFILINSFSVLIFLMMILSKI